MAVLEPAMEKLISAKKTDIILAIRALGRADARLYIPFARDGVHLKNDLEEALRHVEEALGE